MRVFPNGIFVPKRESHLTKASWYKRCVENHVQTNQALHRSVAKKWDWRVLNEWLQLLVCKSVELGWGLDQLKIRKFNQFTNQELLCRTTAIWSTTLRAWLIVGTKLNWSYKSEQNRCDMKHFCRRQGIWGRAWVTPNGPLFGEKWPASNPAPNVRP